VISETQILPHDLEAERAVLGSILLEEKSVFPALEIISHNDFYLEAHRLIFEACESLLEEKSAIDPIIIAAKLKSLDSMERAGGNAYLFSLTDGFPRGTNIRHYSKIVKDKSILRQLIRISNETMIESYDPLSSSDYCLGEINTKLLKLSGLRNSSGFRSMKEIVFDGFKELEARNSRKLSLNGIDSGFSDINRFLGGMKPGNMIVIAARPSMGKTSLALNIACHAALKCNKTIGIFSLEMSSREVYDRMIAAESGANLYFISLGELSKLNWDAVTFSSGNLSDKAKIFIDDSGGITITQLLARSNSLHLAHGVDLLIVDYIQLITGNRKGASRYEDITDISRRMKLLSKDLHCPVIALSQLSRAADGEKPLLSHLKESGAIEQDADVVLLINKKDPAESIAEMIVAKNRNGPTGSFNLAWDRATTKFSDYIPQGY
jgi:replicative DNA helicase